MMILWFFLEIRGFFAGGWTRNPKPHDLSQFILHNTLTSKVELKLAWYLNNTILWWHFNYNMLPSWWSFITSTGLEFSLCQSWSLKITFNLLHNSSRPSCRSCYHRIWLVLLMRAHNPFVFHHRTLVISHMLLCWISESKDSRLSDPPLTKQAQKKCLCPVKKRFLTWVVSFKIQVNRRGPTKVEITPAVYLSFLLGC